MKKYETKTFEMLDFYTIKDDFPTPNFPEKFSLEFVVGMEDTTFCNLQKKGMLERSLDFYSDFRIKSKQILEIKECIQQKQLQNDTDVKILSLILDAAILQKCGIMAFGD